MEAMGSKPFPMSELKTKIICCRGSNILLLTMSNYTGCCVIIDNFSENGNSAS